MAVVCDLEAILLALDEERREREKVFQLTAYRLHCLLRLSLRCRSWCRPTRCSSPVRYFGEVAAQRFESVSLLIDLGCSPDAAAPEKWHRRTPALQCMLQ